MNGLLFTVRPSDSMLRCRYSPGSWDDVVQISTTAAANWAAGAAISYVLRPWDHRLAILWNDPVAAYTHAAIYDPDTAGIVNIGQIPNGGYHMAFSEPTVVGPRLQVYAISDDPDTHGAFVSFQVYPDQVDPFQRSLVSYANVDPDTWMNVRFEKDADSSGSGQNAAADLAVGGVIVPHAHLHHITTCGAVMRTEPAFGGYIGGDPESSNWYHDATTSMRNHYATEVDFRSFLFNGQRSSSTQAVAFPGVARTGGWKARIRHPFARFNYPRRQPIATGTLRNRLYYVTANGELVWHDRNRDLLPVVSDLIQGELAGLSHVDYTFTVPEEQTAFGTTDYNKRFLLIPEDEFLEHIDPWVRYGRIRITSLPPDATEEQEEFLEQGSGFLFENSRLIRVNQDTGTRYLRTYPWQDDWKHPLAARREDTLTTLQVRGIPAGTTWEYYRGFLGPGMWSQDLNSTAYRPFGSFMFESDGYLWLVYLSGSRDPSANRLPPFFARIDIDDSEERDIKINTFEYWPLEEVNGGEHTRVFDWKAKTVAVLYQDPSTLDRNTRLLTINFSNAADPTYHLENTPAFDCPLDGTDNRAVVPPGNLALFAPNSQVTARVMDLEFDRVGQVIRVHYELRSRNPTSASVLVEFDNDDLDRSPGLTLPKVGFRPATPRMALGGVATNPRTVIAEPGGSLHVFEHDVAADEISEHDGFIQYRIRVG